MLHETTGTTGCAAASARSRYRIFPPALRPTWLIGVLAVGSLATGCTTASPAPAVSSAGPASAPDPIALTEAGKRYLKNIYQVECASEYLPYPYGEGPPVPDRTESERREREEKLTTCLEQKVAGSYTKLETIRMITWNGERNVISEGAMQGIARYGDEFLADYVDSLIQGERRREGQADAPAVPTAEAPPSSSS